MQCAWRPFHTALWPPPGDSELAGVYLAVDHSIDILTCLSPLTILQTHHPHSHQIRSLRQRVEQLQLEQRLMIERLHREISLVTTLQEQLARTSSMVRIAGYNGCLGLLSWTAPIRTPATDMCTTVHCLHY